MKNIFLILIIIFIALASYLYLLQGYQDLEQTIRTGHDVSSEDSVTPPRIDSASVIKETENNSNIAHQATPINRVHKETAENLDYNPQKEPELTDEMVEADPNEVIAPSEAMSDDELAKVEAGIIKKFKEDNEKYGSSVTEDTAPPIRGRGDDTTVHPQPPTVGFVPSKPISDEELDKYEASIIADMKNNNEKGEEIETIDKGPAELGEAL